MSHSTESSQKPTSTASKSTTSLDQQSQSKPEQVLNVAQLHMSHHIDNLVAVHPTEYERYERGVTFPRYDNPSEEFWLDPLTLKFGPSRKIGDRWERCVHPEGGLYFCDREKRVLTDAYMHEELPRNTINGFVDKIEQYIAENGLAPPVLPKNRTLVLEIRQTGRCGYYFVDHDSQYLFWLEPYNAFDMIDNLKIEMTLPLFEWKMRSQYWYHNELFPDNIPMADETLHTLENWLLTCAGDMLTSERIENSTSAHSPEQVDKLLALMGDMKADDINSKKLYGVSWTIYRTMSRLCGSAAYHHLSVPDMLEGHSHFLDLHGQHGARLSRQQSIHDPRDGRILVNIVSPLLFFGPQEHFSKLIELSTDCIVRQVDWERFLAETVDEWRNHTLFATVVMNANVAFLGMPSVNGENPVFGSRSSAERTSYVSTVVSIGAVVLGMALVRMHNGRNRRMDMSFLANRSSSIIGLELLAIMYSLPYALAMWSTFLFFVAFAIMCLSSSDVATDILISVSCFLIALTTVWIISASFESQPYLKLSVLSWWDQISMLPKNLVERWKAGNEDTSLTAGRTPVWRVLGAWATKRRLRSPAFP